MSAKTYQRILQVGIFASLGVIFLLFSNLLFPYISSKQLSFNIIMEALLPFWVILIWKFPTFRPKRSYITWGLIAYFAAILLTSFTGIDFNLSFWGDVERLLGFFHIFHFFLFYLYLITVFRNREDWYWLLSASVLVATVEAIIIISDAKIGTIGNTAYVSGYMLFNLYFAALLFLRTSWRRSWPLLIAMVLMLIAFFRADTSGAIIGLGASLFLLVFLLGIFAPRQGLRRTALIVFATGLIAVIALFSQYNQPWFKENSFLKDLSVNKATFQTRWLSWEGAARDFSAHPWLGTGFGNYAITFDRQFSPKFFNYATTETYFDRAHNNLIDIASTTGMVGLLAYLSIFAAAAVAWFRSLRRHGFRAQAGAEGTHVRELLVLAALLAAYFIQNLAVFDSLATYMGLMISLAYLVFLTHQDVVENEDEEEESVAPVISEGKEYSGLAVMGIIMVIIIFNFSIKPWRMLTKVIDAYSYVATGQYALGFQTYREALAINTPLDRDARTTMINIIINNPSIFARFSENNIEESMDFSVELIEKNLKYNENDSLTQMQAAQLYDIISRYYTKQLSVFKEYSDKALTAIDKSIAASPRRIPVYFVKGQILSTRGDMEGAEATFKEAYELNPEYAEGGCQLGNFYYINEKDEYISYVDTCIDKQGTSLMADVLEDAVKRYQEDKDDGRLLLAYRALAKLNTDDAYLFATLAQAEMKAGNLENALAAAQKAGEIDPELKPAVDAFLNSLTATVTPTTTEK